MRNFFILTFFCLFLLTTLTGQRLVQKPTLSFGSRASDSLVLIDFNQKLRGDLWRFKWDFNAPLEEWFGIRLNENGRVFCIDLDGDFNCTAERFGGNHLHGFLPDLQLPFLEHLFLSSNKIEGPLPNFSGTPFLQTLQLSANQFNGEIPDFKDLKKLIKLDLEYNELSGPIPSFDQLSLLEALYLGHNKLNGSLPDFFHNEKLKQIFAEHNKINGSLINLDHLAQLQQLILSNNTLDGSLEYFESNHQLKLLDLSNNNLSGCLTYNRFANIQQLALENNNFSNCSETAVFIPTAFSPNGDGVNDYFEITLLNNNISSNKLRLQIWNQRGLLVYASMDYKNDWDGTSMQTRKGLQEGSYLYQLKIGNDSLRSGWLYIKK